MKTVVAMFPPRIGEGHKRRAAGADAERLATKPAQVSPASCPRLSRASTSFLRQISKQGVDGRDNPGHDSDRKNRHIRFDFMTSIWCGAMVGCIGAAVIPPFPES
jgi:hypothetical protein